MWEIAAPVILFKTNNLLGLVGSERWSLFSPAFVGKVKFRAKVKLKCQRDWVQRIGDVYWEVSEDRFPAAERIG